MKAPGGLNPVRRRPGRIRLKINVANIPEEGLKIQFSREGDWIEEVFPGREKDLFPAARPAGRIDVSATLRRNRETVFFEGQIDTIIEMDCSRCLEIARLPVHARFGYTLVPDRESQGEDVELSAEDLDFVYYRDDLIDTESLIYEQIALQVPIKALCREDCRGLCPHCGINLNQSDCRCREDHVDSRLAVLKKLKF
jgi:uncharacterized protein